jgi:hypothetical protein
MSLKLNVNLGLSVGVLSLLVFTIVIGGYYIDETKKQTDVNNKYIITVDKKLNDFTTKFKEVQKTDNERNNITLRLLVEQEKQLLNMTHAQQIIFQKQISNEEHILGNLTKHRLVSNETRDDIQGLIINNTRILNQLIQNRTS